VVGEQDAKARSVDQPRRPGDVAALQGALEGIGVGGQKFDESRRDLGFVRPAFPVVHQLPYERDVRHGSCEGRAAHRRSQRPQRLAWPIVRRTAQQKAAAKTAAAVAPEWRPTTSWRRGWRPMRQNPGRTRRCAESLPACRRGRRPAPRIRRRPVRCLSWGRRRRRDMPRAGSRCRPAC
jgi:hypothetical protein